MHESRERLRAQQATDGNVVNEARLMEVLEDPILAKAYMMFCKKEHSDENLSFWFAVKSFESTFQNLDKAQRQTEANRIVIKFLTIGAPFEIAIADKLKKDVVQFQSEPS